MGPKDHFSGDPKILIPPSLQPGPLLTPSRSRMGHHFTDHLIVVQTATRRDSPNMTGILPHPTTRQCVIISRSRILPRIRVLWQSLRRHHHQFSSRLQSHRGGEDQTHGCPCEGVFGISTRQPSSGSHYPPLYEDPQI
ncbi:hypothetical protein Hdeb2414_s0014g00429131 [Helianthus debilis subsp. tardiflorus]